MELPHDTADEVWKPIPGFKNNYHVSSLGRVYSRAKGGRILKSRLNAGGYPAMWLGRMALRQAHCLVALAFIGPRPDGMQVNHLDGNKLNPRPENLEYVTPKENVRHASRTGLLARGEKRGGAKLNPEKVMQIRRLHYEGASPRQLRTRFGVCRSTIVSIVRGEKWRHVPQLNLTFGGCAVDSWTRYQNPPEQSQPPANRPENAVDAPDGVQTNPCTFQNFEKQTETPAPSNVITAQNLRANPANGAGGGGCAFDSAKGGT